MDYTWQLSSSPMEPTMGVDMMDSDSNTLDWIAWIVIIIIVIVVAVGWFFCCCRHGR